MTNSATDAAVGSTFLQDMQMPPECFSKLKGRLCGNGLNEDTDVEGSIPLAPAWLILISDARPTIHRQHYLSDLCGISSQGVYQGLTGLEGVNKFTAVKTHSGGQC